jgi:hypothetical protein
LNVRRVHMRKAQILETISTQIGVIAHVEKLEKLAPKIRLRFNFISLQASTLCETEGAGIGRL